MQISPDSPHWRRCPIATILRRDHALHVIYIRAPWSDFGSEWRVGKVWSSSFQKYTHVWGENEAIVIKSRISQVEGRKSLSPPTFAPLCTLPLNSAKNHFSSYNLVDIAPKRYYLREFFAKNQDFCEL